MTVVISGREAYAREEPPGEWERIRECERDAKIRSPKEYTT